MGNSGIILVLIILAIIVGLLIFIIKRTKKNEKIIIDENGVEVKSGLGGWLILVGFGVLIGPFIILTQVPKFLTIFKNGSYEILTTSSNAAYHPLWAPVIWGEILINTVLFFACIYLIFLFFSKKVLFPKLYIGIALGSLIFVILDAVLVKVVVPSEQIFNPETIKDVFRSLVGVIIWVPYMIKSKRVKVTFVK